MNFQQMDVLNLSIPRGLPRGILKFKHLEDLMSEAWLEHELMRGNLRDLFTVYYCWLSEEGIEHKRH